MPTRPHRRTFLRQGAVLGGGFSVGGSATLPAHAAETSPRATKPDTPHNETLQTIGELRTVHGNFLDKPLPEADLETILKAGVRAANSSNMQSYSIVVVRDRDKMKQICTYQGSCLLVFCVDLNRQQAYAERLGYTYLPDNIVDFVTASINTGLVVQTAAIAARSLGIDSLITNGIHRGDMERVWKLLDLPETSCFPLIAMVLGYPTEEPAHLKGRLAGPGVIHREKYHRMTKEEVEQSIREYDDPERHLALNDVWKSKGYDHYLDWFFRDWTRNSEPTKQETQMLRLLKRSGFVELQKV